MKGRGWSTGALIAVVVGIVVAIGAAAAPRASEHADRAGRAIEFAVSVDPVTLAVRDGDVTIEIEL